MDTIVAGQRGVRPPTRKRYDRVFFSGMVLVASIIIVVGFGPTYYFAGLFRAHLPSAMIQLHGAVFSVWVLFLVVQTGLISAGRVKLHRTLGVSGFVLAGLVFICGLLAAASQLHFRESAGRRILVFPINFITTMTFGVLTALAYAVRKRSTEDHKRLILLATTPLVLAAIDRWPIHYLYHDIGHDILASYLFLLSVVIYDLWSSRKIYRSTVWGSLFVLAMTQMSAPLGSTAAWQSFARWVQSLRL